MAQPTIQFQNVLDAITNLQTQLNTLQTQITKIGTPVNVPSTPSHDLLITEGGSFTLLNMPLDTVLFGAGPGADPTATNIPNCVDSTHFLSYSTSGHALSAPVVFNNQGSTTTVLHGNAAGNPSFGAVSLTTDVSGVLPVANGGTGSATGLVVTVTTQKFTASGTYTPHAGLLFAIVECVGGGGGGGGVAASSANGAAGGGGAGSYSRVRLTAAQIGVSQTITVGAAGLAGATGNNPGGNGGDTSLGTLCIGKGGTGGGGAAANGGATGGAGGVAGTGDFTPVGTQGGTSNGGGAGTPNCPSGYGAASVFGGGVAGVTASGGATNGNAGTNYGAGGSGGMCNASGAGTAAGGAGASGIVIVTEYNNQ